MLLRVKNMICLFAFALFSLALEAVVEVAQLKIDGNFTQVLGKKHCGAAGDVEIVLPPATWAKGNNFRAYFRPGKKATTDTKKAKSDSCDPTLADGAPNTETFTKGSPFVAAKKFLTPAACSDGVTEDRIVCIYEGAGGTELLAYGAYRIETIVAKIESVGEPSATNGEVTFEVIIKGVSGSPYKIQVCYGKADGDIDADKNNCDLKKFKSEDFTSSPVTISGLENDVKYAFKVRLHEAKEEPTKWEPSFVATPERAAEPFGEYNGGGGELSCQQTSTTSLLMLFGLMFIFSFFRSRKKFSKKMPSGLMLACLLLPLGSAKEAHAKIGQMNLGILGSMYRPDLDSEIRKDGKPIFPFYQCFFRRKETDTLGPINPLLGVEMDWHLWDGFGSLQLGVGLGYTFAQAHAARLDSSGQPNCNSAIGKATSIMHMYQIRPQLTYAFDYFADVVPFVPYVRGALISHGYLFRQGGKAAPAHQSEGVTIKSNGFRFGYQAAVGLMLRMDFLEPSAVRAARGQGYLEHVYLKSELSITKIDSFGRKGFQYSAKDVMGTRWPLMWTFGLVFEMP
jgi:hypothetical protein